MRELDNERTSTSISIQVVALDRLSLFPGRGRSRLAALAFIAVLLGVLAEALDRDDVLALGGAEERHALRAAAGDADVVDRHADDLAAIGDQHDLVAVLDREGGDELAVPLVDRHGDDAF